MNARAVWLSTISIACASLEAAAVPVGSPEANDTRPCAEATVRTTGRTTRGTAFDVTGCGPPILLVHGFSADRRMWDALTIDWSHRYRVVRVDLKSHGESADAHRDDDPVADLLAVLDTQHIARATLVGHSVGAAHAVDLAARAPERVAALVLLSPSLTGFRAHARVPLDAVAARVRARDAAGAAAAWLHTSIMRTTLHGDAAERFEDMILANQRIWDRTSPVPSPPAAPLAERLAALRAPLLLAAGAGDSSGTREAVAMLAAVHPASVQHVHATGGHWFPLESPDVVRAWVDAFLAPYRCATQWRAADQACPVRE